MVRQELSRRKALKRLGATTGLATLGTASVFTDTAAASGTEISDSAWNDYVAWEQEQLQQCNGYGCIEPNATIDFPNPKTFGFDICAYSGSAPLCVTMGDQFIQKYHECAGQTLHTVSYTMTRYETEGSPVIAWTQSGWIGYDSAGCLWIGVDSGAGEDACTKHSCSSSYYNTIYAARQVVHDGAMKIVDQIQNATNGSPSTVGGTVIAGAAGGAFLYLARNRNPIVT